MKSVLPNATARIRANTSKPVFYFYFDEANARYAQNAASGVWLSGPAATVSSPNEFSLVRFKEKKNGREARVGSFNIAGAKRSEEHTSELQSLMRNSYAVFCLKKKKKNNRLKPTINHNHKS